MRCCVRYNTQISCIYTSFGQSWAEYTLTFAFVDDDEVSNEEDDAEDGKSNLIFKNKVT